MVNSIRSKALNHRQFKTMLDEMDAQYGDVLYHQEVRWLNRALLNQLNLQLQGKDRLINQLPDCIRAFDFKLQLLQRHLSTGNLAHFPNLKEVDRTQSSAARKGPNMPK
ncbi:hypothetical protein AAFF_G00125880 [Aldrovandia affinis]|uniref:Uncharacterized protein n=1 Tax=Aldrovandia affinis TaxID=143900 RepID=A0AAD7RR72_9TELE|nr:hypothetical protein AAFF_G00125880 [Aldrovandia affinis]